MKIDTSFTPAGNLQMDAYTYSLEEFAALEATLVAAGISPTYQLLPQDSANRDGRRYTVPSAQLSAIERLLQGQFQPTGLFVPSAAATGANFACREISLRGSASGCENVTAPNLNVARVECALVARRKNWFGGVPKRGMCP